MKKIITSLLIVSFLISSCTHNFNMIKYESKLEFYKRVNNICDGRDEFILRTTDGKELKVNNFVMMPDSSQYINLLNNKSEFIKTDSLKEMEYKLTAGGIIEGAGLGCLSAGAAATLITLPFVHDGYAAFGAAMIVSVVTLVGLITGGIWGGIHQSSFILNLQQQQNPKGK